MSKKSFIELAWNVDEEVYRADPAISYSALSGFDRLGPSSLCDTSKLDTPSIRFGSLVDTLLTDAKSFDDKYLISSIDMPKDSMIPILNALWESTQKPLLSMIEDAGLLAVIDEFKYFQHWLPATRIKDVRTNGSEYYKLLAMIGDKTVISQTEFDEARSCVEKIKLHPKVGKLFMDDDFNKEIETFYQLKFKQTIHINCLQYGIKTEQDYTPIQVRCMFDRLIINHSNKTIQPIDLKTTGHNEEEFENSFFAWRYYIQGTLYPDILKAVIAQDDYFKDFTVLPFIFAVINKNSQQPMAWYFSEKDLKEYAAAKKLRLYPELLAEVYWHNITGVYNMTRKTYESGGVRKIEFKL